jgi:hypothetical protein
MLLSAIGASGGGLLPFLMASSAIATAGVGTRILLWNVTMPPDMSK